MFSKTMKACQHCGISVESLSIHGKQCPLARKWDDGVRLTKKAHQNIISRELALARAHKSQWPARRPEDLIEVLSRMRDAASRLRIKPRPRITLKKAISEAALADRSTQ